MIAKKEKFDYSLRCYEKDFNSRLKPVSILNFMQDSASVNAENLGFGESFVFEKNLAWFVLKYRIEIFNQLTDPNSISVETQSRGAARLFAYRDFEFYNDGEMFARAASQWALVNFDTKKMVKPQDEMKTLDIYEKKEYDLEFDKIPALTEVSTQKEFEILFDNIDMNKHVNNTNYLAWALETLDFEFKCKFVAKNIDMYFKHDISYGGRILAQTQILDEGLITNHSIKNAQTGDELCAIKVEWETL